MFLLYLCARMLSVVCFFHFWFFFFFALALLYVVTFTNFVLYQRREQLYIQCKHCIYDKWSMFFAFSLLFLISIHFWLILIVIKFIETDKHTVNIDTLYASLRWVPKAIELWGQSVYWNALLIYAKSILFQCINTSVTYNPWMAWLANSIRIKNEISHMNTSIHRSSPVCSVRSP